MKIHSNKPPETKDVSLNVNKTSRAGGGEKASSSGKTSSTDKVDISATGKEVAGLMSAIGQLPDLRMDKINTIKEAIQSGTYKIDSVKIAERILNEL